MALGFHQSVAVPYHPIRLSHHLGKPSSSSEPEMIMTNLPTEKNTNKRHPRNVSFQEEVSYRIIESTSSISSKDRKKRWVSSDDFVQFKQDCMMILKEIHEEGDDSSSNSNNSYISIFQSFRGLEMVDPACTAKRQRHNTNSVSAVLLEQREQRMKRGRKTQLKSKDIRKVYKTTTTESMKEAIENAYLDRKAVQDLDDDLSSIMRQVQMEHSEEEEEQRRRRQRRSSVFSRISTPRIQKPRRISAGDVEKVAVLLTPRPSSSSSVLSTSSSSSN